MLESIPFVLLSTGLACTACQGQSPGERSVKFKKHTLSSEFISEGVAAGDVNKDGKTDIMAGAYWFEAPDWTPHELAKPETFHYDKGYSNSFLNFTLDVNHDGWVDLIRVDFPGKAAVWHENPRNEAGHWKVHTIYGSVGNESPAFVDMDGDGRPDLLCADSEAKQMIWLRAPDGKGAPGWERFPISAREAPGTEIFSHGLGLGDVNGDGRPDVVIKEGWWEAPADPRQPGWTFHPADLGKDCAQMYVLDVNEDGYADVLSSSAHRYGIWWHEQDRDEQDRMTWKEHEISKAFSQTHALDLADINGDGHPDLVTGMRYFAHLGKDPGELNPPLLCWLEFKPGKKPAWVTHQIDDDSGVGLNIVTEDMNGNGLTDIVIANKKGVFFFEQQK